MCKSLNQHLDKIEKQTVEEMLSAEHRLQGQLKEVMVAMEIKRTYFDDIHQDVNKIKKYCHSVICHNHVYRHAPYPDFEN
jgi:hypothetical protein